MWTALVRTRVIFVRHLCPRPDCPARYSRRLAEALNQVCPAAVATWCPSSQEAIAVDTFGFKVTECSLAGLVTMPSPEKTIDLSTRPIRFGLDPPDAQVDRLGRLRLREVIVVRDRDDAGDKFANQVKERMSAHAGKIRVLTPPMPFTDIGDMPTQAAREFLTSALAA